MRSAWEGEAQGLMLRKPLKSADFRLEKFPATGASGRQGNRRATLKRRPFRRMAEEQ